LLVREAGGAVFDYDGSPHDDRSRFTLAATPALAGAVQQIVTESMSGS
jgi:hypothetical protein